MEILNKTFEEFWGYYWRVTSRHRIPGIFQWDHDLVNLIEEQCGINPGASILDLGCGGGDQAKVFAEKGYSVTGIDRVPALIEYASSVFRQEGFSGNFRVGDMRDINYRDEFDLCVILSGTFGLLNEEENEQLLQKIHRALKPGGQAVLSYSSTEHRSGIPYRRWWNETEEGYSLFEEWFDVPTATYRTRYIFILNEGKIIKEPDRDDYNSNEVIRCYGCREIENLIERNGYEVRAHLSSKQIGKPDYILSDSEPRGLIFIRKKDRGN